MHVNSCMLYRTAVIFAADTTNPRTRKLSRSGLNRVSDYAVLLRLFCRGSNLFWAS